MLELQGENYITAKHQGSQKESGVTAVKVGKKDGNKGQNISKKCCSIDSEYFFKKYKTEFSEILSNEKKESLRKMFTSTAQYYSNEKRNCNLKHIAYMLATAKLETANTFNPIDEYGGNSYFERMYDPILGKDQNRRSLSIRNGNDTQGDGVKYHGRGFVQLTWKGNYKKMKAKFNIDLISNPEKALEHELAMKIMIYGMENGTFTGKKLSDYINENKTDYLNSRRIINGTDRASDIKGYAEKIEKCLKIECNCKKENKLDINEFGLVQVTKLGNPYIINSGVEDSYSYTKKDGSTSAFGKHGDDWMLPEKAQAFSKAVYDLVKGYPLQKIYLGDCSAYNPNKNLGHSATGAHSSGNAFDCRFLKSDGSGSNNINNLTVDEIKINGRFIEILKATGHFSTFYTDNGKIPGSVHSSGHADHIHGN